MLDPAILLAHGLSPVDQKKWLLHFMPMMESTLGLDLVPPGRQIYSNRTLNLRTIRAIGYDMDYTLVHYRADVWEQRVYDRIKGLLAADGWPVEELEFDPDLGEIL